MENQSYGSGQLQQDRDIRERMKLLKQYNPAPVRGTPARGWRCE